MLKIGIFGVGQLGEIHARMLIHLPDTFRIVGFNDPDDTTSEALIQTTGLTRYTDPEALMDTCDCITIAAPVPDHFDLAMRAIKKSKHVFIAQPVTQTAEEAKILLQLAAEASVQVQAGYPERFNPAFTGALQHITRPLFIEAHRLIQDQPKVSVVQDLMIHDLDLILSIVNSNIKRVSANSVAVFGNTPDIVSARIEFDNGCVANLTASRISTVATQTMQVFQRDSHVSIDLLEHSVALAHQQVLAEALAEDRSFVRETGESAFTVEHPVIPECNATEAAFLCFARAIRTNSIPTVSIEDAYRSMELAEQITARLKRAGKGHQDSI